MNNDISWGFVLFVTVLAILVTALLTTPLPFLWRTHLAGFYGSDAFSHAWSTWWFDKALLELHRSPAQMDRIYHPVQFFHPILVATPWVRLLALPGIHWGGTVATYNVQLFVSYVLTWLMMTLLCVDLTGDQTAAVIGGAVFTFCANRTLHALNGHFTQIMTYPCPILVLCLRRTLKHPTDGRGFALGGALIMASTVDLMTLAYFTMPITVSVLIAFLLSDRQQLFSRPTLRALGIGFSSAALVVLPLMWPLISQGLQGRLGFYQAPGILDYSADALGLFIPPPGHLLCNLWPALQQLSKRLIRGIGYTESIVYAGWVTVILAVVGAAANWRRNQAVRLWVLVAVGASLLALGPVLWLGGQRVTIDGQSLMMPYGIVRTLPLLSWGRTPARLNLTAMFAIAILAAYGGHVFLAKLRRIWRPVLALGLLALVLLDATFLFPWPMADANVPEFYTEIAADRRSVAILPLPILDYTADKYYLLHQMTHGHAISGGYSYRRPAEAREALIQLKLLTRPGGNPLALADYGIAYVILHRDFLGEQDLETTRAYLERKLGAPLYNDENIVAFRVPDPLEIAPPPLQTRQ